jgi:hypothetical protein
VILGVTGLASGVLLRYGLPFVILLPVAASVAALPARRLALRLARS